jgi:hypothetical protein
MVCIDRHHDIVKESDREAFIQEVLHQRKIQAYAHPVLVAFAVKRSRREKTALVEVHRKVEFALTRRELGGKFYFVAFVDGSIERAEIVLNTFVKRIQFCLHRTAVGVIGRLGGFALGLRTLVLAHRITVIIQP